MAVCVTKLYCVYPDIYMEWEERRNVHRGKCHAYRIFLFIFCGKMNLLSVIGFNTELQS